MPQEAGELHVEMVSNSQEKAPVLASAGNGARFVTNREPLELVGGGALTRFGNVFNGADLESWAGLAHGSAVR